MSFGGNEVTEESYSHYKDSSLHSEGLNMSFGGNKVTEESYSDYKDSSLRSEGQLNLIYGSSDHFQTIL